MKLKYSSLLACAGFAALLITASTANAKPKPILDSAQSFAVLGGTAVTLSNSVIVGDVGVDHGPLTQTTSTISGQVHVGDMVAQKAYDDFLLAYVALADIACTGSLDTAYTNTTLTLTPGVYCNTAGVTFTNTTLTLDAQGDSNAVWIFKIGTLGTGALTGTDFTVKMTNGGTCNNVYWWTADAATLTGTVIGSSPTFIGSILAGASITATDSTLDGQALATVAVTLTRTTVSVCGGGSTPAKPKANEGVGNGVDGNTPGHLHNGGNDDPAFSPGNPGAKHK